MEKNGVKWYKIQSWFASFRPRFPREMSCQRKYDDTWHHLFTVVSSMMRSGFPSLEVEFDLTPEEKRCIQRTIPVILQVNCEKNYDQLSNMCAKNTSYRGGKKYPYLIIGWWRCLWGMGGLGSGPRCGPDGLGQCKTPDMPESVWDGLWRPVGAFFQIGFGCVMSHHHIERLCTFLFKFWRENSKWRSCQQLVLQKYSL